MEQLDLDFIETEGVSSISSSTLPHIIFKLKNHKYALSSEFVIHMEALGDITPMIDMDAHCCGMKLFDGVSVPIYNLRSMFDVDSPENAQEESNQQDQADESGNQMLIYYQVDGVIKGIVVDSVSDIQVLQELFELPQFIADTKSKYILCVAKDNNAQDKERIIQVVNAHAI